MRLRFLALIVVACSLLSLSPLARAQEPRLRLGGYAEAFWQWNFRRPANHLTNYRGFDNRHNSFTLANAVLDASADVEDVLLRVAFQVGHTPSTYYAAEPLSPGSAGANQSDAALWKYVQQANVGYRFHLGERALLVSAGVFLSPIGPEALAVHGNWFWSRSNLFVGLPFYHTGARVELSLTPAWTLGAAVFNGWNSVVDNNDAKSGVLSAVYSPAPTLSVGLLYFGGRERTPGGPEGNPIRNLFDAHVTWHINGRFSLLAHANTGFERNRIGVSRWVAGQLGGRVVLLRQLSFAVRQDAFYDREGRGHGLRASAIVWPARWVASSTATLSFDPSPYISFRLEARHDEAAQPLFFREHAETPNTRRQDTVTLGATAHF